MAKPTRKKRGSEPSMASILGAQMGTGLALQELLERESAAMGIPPEQVLTSTEFRQQMEKPPEKKPFPSLLFGAVCAIELLDVAQFPAALTGIWTLLYGSFRLCVTGYLYYWSFSRIEGVKMIGTRRQLVKSLQQKIIIPVISNLPIPFIGGFLEILPADAFFVVLTHNDHSKAVQALWSALGVPQKANVNITRSKRGPQVEVGLEQGDKSERKAV